MKSVPISACIKVVYLLTISAETSRIKNRAELRKKLRTYASSSGFLNGAIHLSMDFTLKWRKRNETQLCVASASSGHVQKVGKSDAPFVKIILFQSSMTSNAPGRTPWDWTDGCPSSSKQGGRQSPAGCPHQSSDTAYTQGVPVLASAHHCHSFVLELFQKDRHTCKVILDDALGSVHRVRGNCHICHLQK